MCWLFFAQHDVADKISDGPQAAQLLPKANGRPSGQAVVQMRSRQEAEEAQTALTGKYVGSRYIEVFVYGNNDGGEGATASGDGANYPLAGMGAPPSFSLPLVGAAAIPAQEPAPAQPEPLPDWAAGFAQAAPWALPWGSLPPPLSGGVGPPPPVVGGGGLGPALPAGEVVEPTWENIMSFSAPGVGMTAPVAPPPVAIEAGSAEVSRKRTEDTI